MGGVAVLIRALTTMELRFALLFEHLRICFALFLLTPQSLQRPARIHRLGLHFLDLATLHDDLRVKLAQRGYLNGKRAMEPCFIGRDIDFFMPVQVARGLFKPLLRRVKLRPRGVLQSFVIDYDQGGAPNHARTSRHGGRTATGGWFAWLGHEVGRKTFSAEKANVGCKRKFFVW